MVYTGVRTEDESFIKRDTTHTSVYERSIKYRLLIAAISLIALVSGVAVSLGSYFMGYKGSKYSAWVIRLASLFGGAVFLISYLAQVFRIIMARQTGMISINIVGSWVVGCLLVQTALCGMFATNADMLELLITNTISSILAITIVFMFAIFKN